MILPLLELAIAGRVSLRNNTHWLYIEQIVTRNWSSAQPPDIGDLAYVLGLVAALVINFGPLVAIFGALMSLVRRKADMDLVNAFASHDLTIETTIVRNLLMDDFTPPARREEFLRRIRTSVAEARDDWFGPLLDEMYGREEAEKIRQRIRETRIAP